MGYVTKSTDIDLEVEPIPLSDEDRQAISSIIGHYKTTGEILKLVKKKQVVNSSLETLVS